LVAIRKRIGQARVALDTANLDPGWLRELLRELANEAEKLAGYVGQPDMEVVALYHAMQGMGAVPKLLAEELGEDEETHEFRMQDVVDILTREHPHIAAYVEQTGGGCATIYAAQIDVPGEPTLYQQPAEPGWGTWPVMAGPGTFDWGGDNHTASLDDFYVGPDDALMEGNYDDRVYTAGREDTPETLAAKIAAAVEAFTPTRPGVTVWPGR
jgi:hypothetical protein